ncbi:hypothetical protein SGFS_053910 [Streptomyces graminofaciens]|uniref:Lipoprotein n=1 Tax=Streptomyces graminofaciens TaxID=68212 RepID=A0ABN5VPI1_9ACTN|nr:hypothetical protein [Streptomyces graminofaciens]BBC34097.1 hypothetical protein SGFS_053910 [Streptomyces graminofaciens]
MAGLLGIVVACGLTAGCGAEDTTGPAATADGESSRTPTATKPDPQAAILYPELLEAALPRGVNTPTDITSQRTVKAWDMTDPSVCQSHQWPDDWCAKAIAVGLGGYTNMNDQEVVVKLISFDEQATAAALFKGEGTPDEVGENPPGDQIDGFELESSGGWSGSGINVRQGAVIAKIEYTWAEGGEVPGQLMDFTKMVVERVRQAQRGENPTWSLR